MSNENLNSSDCNHNNGFNFSTNIQIHNSRSILYYTSREKALSIRTRFGLHSEERCWQGPRFASLVCRVNANREIFIVRRDVHASGSKSVSARKHLEIRFDAGPTRFRRTRKGEMNKRSYQRRAPRKRARFRALSTAYRETTTTRRRAPYRASPEVRFDFRPSSKRRRFNFRRKNKPLLVACLSFVDASHLHREIRACERDSD